MDKRAVAQIVVGSSRGTGFLVSRDGLVLTSLHVIANRDASLRNQCLKPFDAPILLQFGDPADASTWTPDQPAELVPELYSLGADWAVLQCKGPIPGDVTPFVLAELTAAPEQAQWETFGFPDAAATIGNDFGGEITSWGDHTARLHSDAAAGVAMRGISGAPCVVEGNTVGLIERYGVPHPEVDTAGNWKSPVIRVVDMVA